MWFGAHGEELKDAAAAVSWGSLHGIHWGQVIRELQKQEYTGLEEDGEKEVVTCL